MKDKIVLTILFVLLYYYKFNIKTQKFTGLLFFRNTIPIVL